MLKTVCLMSVFNEEDLLEESVSSVAPHVDRVLIFDGPFLEYPTSGIFAGGVEVSCDATRELVHVLHAEHGNVSYVPAGRMTQDAKRSFMFSFLDEGDLAFVLDGDEIVYGDFSKGLAVAKEAVGESAKGVAYVRVLDLRAAKDWRPRFFLKHGRMEYDGWIRVRRDDVLIVDLKNEVSFQPRVSDLAVVNLRVHYRSEGRERDGLTCKEALLRKVR